MQQPFSFMLPQVDWRPPTIASLPSWADAKRISIDIETKDPELRDHKGKKGLGPGTYRPGNHITGIGFAIEDGPAQYVPIRHEGGDNCDLDHALQYFRDQAKFFSGTVVGSNLGGYDLGYLQKDGVEFPKVKQFYDVSHAAVIINELHFKYSLDAQAEREGLPGKDRSVLDQYARAHKIDPTREMYKLPGRAVAQYVLQDVRLPLTLARRYDKQIDDGDLHQIWKLECDVLPVLVKMRRRGVRVNVEKIQRVMRWAAEQGEIHLKKAAAIAGLKIGFDEVWEAAAMARVLRAAKIDVPETAKGKDSITKTFLKKAGPVGEALLRAREMSKLTQFARRTLLYQINGRVHCVLHQLRNTKEGGNESEEESKGARFGRFSAEHYNIQQEPARDDEFGEMWRDIYEPELGAVWVCADWSQQEPRIAVHYAELLGLSGARDFADRYRRDPATDCHQMLADLTGIPRKIVKNYFNGCIYGMGDAKLCRAIGHRTVLTNRNGKVVEVPGPEGQAIITLFRSKLPWVGMLTREAAKQAEKRGVVWTVLRRRCNFPRKPDGSGYDWVHKAFSRIGQGGAADQAKATMVEADRAGIPLQLAVHDEFDWSCTEVREAKHMKQLMMETVKFNVPMLVDLEIGTSWGKLTKLSIGESVGRALHFGDN